MHRFLVRPTVIAFVVGAALAATAPQASATVICDLQANISCPAINSGLFFRDEQQPTGTGYIDSFLRVQQNGWEQGYNTSDRSYPGGSHMQPIIQDKTDPNFTRDLPLANVGTKTINGTLYAEFFLDVNEQATNNGAKSLITLDQLEIFKSNTPSLNNYAPGTVNVGGANGSLTGATKVYDLDNGGGANPDNWVQIDYNVSGGGSGQSDMVFYLPYNLLAGSKYVYLFSQFGKIDNNNQKYASGAGFEEWWTMSPTQVTQVNGVPEPGSLTLLGLGLIAVSRWGRRQRRKKREGVTEAL